MHRRLFLLSTLATLATPVAAAPTRYVLAPEGSQITFSFALNGNRQTGTAPVARADLRIDPKNLSASKADVTVDISRAKTGLIFATQALKSGSVLDTANHPEVRFVATKFTLGAAGRISEGAVITGQLTLRGVTRPIRLKATLTRPAGTARDDLSRLNVRLTGSLSRADFGATGYSDLVDDRIDLDVTADIRAAN